MPFASEPQLSGLADRLADAPLVDQHCHSLVREWHRVDGPTPDWRRCFTEAVRPASLDHDVATTLGYMEFVRALAPYVGVPTDGAGNVESDVARARDGLAPRDGYAASLFDDAGISSVLIDTGYPRGDALDSNELEALVGRPVRTVVRVEFDRRVSPRERPWFVDAGDL